MEGNNEIDFISMINEVIRIAKTEGNKLTPERIKELIGDDLPDEKMDAVYEYLSSKGVIVEGYKYIDDENIAPRNHNYAKTDIRTDLKKDIKTDIRTDVKNDANTQKSATITDKSVDLEEKSEDNYHKSKALSYYMNELKSNDIICDTDSDITILTGDDLSLKKESKERLITYFLPKVVEIADSYLKEYEQYGIYKEDIISEGNINLVTVMEEISLEPVYKEKDKDYIVGYILDSIKKGMDTFIENETGEKLSADSVISKLNLLKTAEDYLTSRLARKPSLSELSEYTSVSVEEISALKDLRREDK